MRARSLGAVVKGVVKGIAGGQVYCATTHEREQGRCRTEVRSTLGNGYGAHKKTGRLAASGQWRADSGHKARLASLFEQCARVNFGPLAAGPGLGLIVIDRVDEACPALLVYKRVVHPVSVRPETRMPTDRDSVGRCLGPVALSSPFTSVIGVVFFDVVPADR